MPSSRAPSPPPRFRTAQRLIVATALVAASLTTAAQPRPARAATVAVDAELTAPDLGFDYEGT